MKGRGRRGTVDVQRRSRLLRLGSAVLAAMAVLVGLDWYMRPAVEYMASYHTQVYAVRIINDAMVRELERNSLGYGDIVHISRNAEGVVSSVQTDMVAVNTLKNNMVNAILTELERPENRSLGLPLGSLFGNQLTAGRGPEVEIVIRPTGYVQSELYNQFSSAGINQTLHQVMLKVNVSMVAVFPGYTVQTDTATNYCVAQTVIVGAVPEGYTDINGDDSSTIAKFNDYNQSEAR